MSDHHPDHMHATHTHDGKPIQNDDRPPIKAETLETAVRELLIEKGVISAEEIHRAIEMMDEKGTELGARIVARAWVDDDFKQRLLSEGDAAVREFGVDMRPTELCVIENTDDVHNMVVCTLCSCYPRAILGIPPAWYKRRDYRARAVREPRSILTEFGTSIPEDKQVRVHDSNADLRYLVLPQRPAGTEDWSEEQLAELVSRDSMIGVADIRGPGE
ncbi:MAG: nitrile hydratase subunit alpha [Alphaproteobacteria bacterium]|nr:nitrile hydratase subunit alpha [Alphaproteobacteria bacterium]